MRSLFLTVLLVGSVVGGTVAFSGSAAAVANTEPEVVSVVEDGGAVEVAFNTAVEKNETTAGGGYTPAFADDTPLDDEAIEVYVRQAGSPDYNVYTARAVRGARRGAGITVVPQGQTGTSGTGDARYIVRIPALGDLSPAADVKVNFTQPVDNADEEPPGVYAAAITNVSVPTTSAASRESGPGGGQTAHNTRASAAEVYQGERVAVEANAVDTDAFVRNVGTGRVVLDGSTGVNSRYLELDTAELETGATYKVTFGDTTGPGKFFNVSSLGLEATLDQTGREFAWDENVTLDVRASAVRGNAQVVVNTGAGRPPINRERLDGNAEFAAEYDAGTNRSGTVSADEYTVTVTDVQTGITAVAGRFSVEDFPDAESARLAEGVVTEHRGDVVAIPIRLENSEEGAPVTLSVGGLGSANYVTNLTVVDENGNGKITVEWNTFTAGVNDLHRVFNVTGPDTIDKWEWERGPFVDELRNGTGGYNNLFPARGSDTLTDGNRDGNQDRVYKNVTFAKNLTVDATTYELQVVANGGDEPRTVSNFTDVDADDRGQVSLAANGVDASQVWVTAGENADDVDRGWIRDTLDRNADEVDGNLTRTDVVTDGEVIVQRIEARGIEGVVENRTAFVAPRQSGVSATVAFLNETRQAIQYRDRRYAQGDRDGDGTADEPTELADTLTPSWDIGYDEVASAFNRDPRQFNVNASTVEFVPDYGNDTYYVLVDLDAVESEKLTDGLDWWANFTLSGQTSLSQRTAAGAGNTSDVWEYQAPDATLGTDVDDRVVVRKAEGQVVRGETNVAPGTRLELRFASDSEASPFIETPETRVTARRTFSATVDFFAAVGQGTNFTAVVRRDGRAISDEYDGRVVGLQRASVSMGNQRLRETDQVVVLDRVRLSDGGFVAVHYGSASGRVLGASKYLEPGPHSDVRIPLDDALTRDATLVAMVHVDDNPNRLFDFPSADAPYTTNGTAVTDRASVAVGTDATQTPTPPRPLPSTATRTPTSTAPPTTASPTPTPTPTPRPSPRAPSPATTTGGGPGFGAGVGVVAVAIAAAFLAARRRE